LLSKRERCPSLVNVYLALLYHADSHGLCFPGYERIMELVGIRGKATVSKALRILKKEGLIAVFRSHGVHGSNRYLLQSSMSEPQSSTIELKGSIIELLKFNEKTPKVQSLNSQSSMSELELYPFNYNHLTRPTQLYRGRERNGSRKKFGPPEDPRFDREYYLS
jgi:hypothetical protein